ncbi:MAG: 50S ribosomal protein L23 [Coriobacteriales bacterium]|jgi:large subunit ribosomal protein L23
MQAREIIIRPIITERSFDMQEYNRYTFEVAKSASKIEIAKAIEEIFDVHVTKVNTVNVKSKPKRMRYIAGRTRTWKKAIVTLAEGDTIEVFGN